MKIRVRDEPLVCDICKETVQAVVDSPSKNGGPWGYFCRNDIGEAMAHWRDSTITTMLVRTPEDAF